MKNSNKILHLIFSLTILLQAALFQVATPNLVLCIGDDGHIAFEWPNDKEHCSHDIELDRLIFSNSENKFAGINETGCTDIDLHFHPSSANKAQKKNHSIFSAKTFGQHNLWSMEKANKSTTINLQYNTLFNPIIETVKHTILII